jgi:hypothetical protein
MVAISWAIVVDFSSACGWEPLALACEIYWRSVLACLLNASILSTQSRRWLQCLPNWT